MALGVVIIVFLLAFNSAGTDTDKRNDKYERTELVTEIPDEVTAKTSYSWEVVRAPSFSSTDVLTNQEVALKNYEGSLILLNFVNYGCNPNINKIVSAQLLAVKELIGERSDFETLSVFCGCCPIETLKNFAIQNEFNWTWSLDSDYSIIQLYRDYVAAYGYPTLVFIDASGYIQDATGYLDRSELDSKLDEFV